MTIEDVDVRPRESGNPERLVCACSGLTERDILTSFGELDNSFERLVTATGVGTKCTACMLDVDLILDGIAREHQKHAKKGAGVTIQGFFLRPDDQVHCGHFTLEEQRKTILRIANLGLMFSHDTPLAEYTFRFTVMSPDGKVIHRRKEKLAAHETMQIEFDSIHGITPRGWFIADLLPVKRGVVASLRPQVGITGLNWASVYHPQWLSFRTRRRAILVQSDEGYIDLMPILINIEDHPARVRVDVFGTDIDYKTSAMATIPARGMIHFDCGKQFTAPQGLHSMICAIESDRPLNYFLVNKHRDGAWCTDHFPNEK